MATLVEMKIYVSQNTKDAIARECQQCNCAQTAFVRTAILREIQRRNAARVKAKDAGELAGQLTIGDAR